MKQQVKTKNDIFDHQGVGTVDPNFASFQFDYEVHYVFNDHCNEQTTRKTTEMANDGIVSTPDANRRIRNGSISRWRVYNRVNGSNSASLRNRH